LFTYFTKTLTSRPMQGARIIKVGLIGSW